MEWLVQNWVWIVVALAFVVLMSRQRLAHHSAGGAGEHGHGDLRPRRSDERTGARGVTPAAVDPVSGSAVGVEHGLSSVYAGRIYYFETADTRRRFEAEPQRYAAQAPGVPIGTGPSHTRRHPGC